MSYGYDRYSGQPYGHYADEREVPDDIDGKPPADFPYNQPSSSSRFWRPPTFRGGPDYYPSPTRRDPPDRYSGYPPSGYQDTGYGRGPERGYLPAAYLPQEYDRRPLPHRREPEAGPRYDAGAGYPPPAYEPEGRYTSPDRGPPPPPPPPTGPPAPRGPPPMEGTPVFPPMPYEPAGSPASTGPLAEESAALPQEPPAEVFPPLPYEPEGPPPPEEVPYPPPGEDRGEGGPGEGALPEGHYGSPSTVHGHIKTQHFAGCKDYWAAFLFILHFWAVVGVCIYLGLRGVIKTNQNNDLIHAHYLAPAPAPALPHHLYSIRNWAPQLGAAAGSGWIFALIWQSLLRMFPKPMIYVCLSMGAVATGLLGIILISTGTAKGLVGLIFLVSALFQGLYVHLVQPRIPFAAIMLNKALRDVQMHKMLYVVSTWTSLLGMFWLALWIFGVSGAVSLPYGGWYVALLVISLAWSVEVLRNVVNVTVARVVGTVYFEEGNLPLFLVLNAYRRAWTIAFGSICLGSMFVAIVQGLYAVAKRLANEQGENEFLFSCVNCFLGLQEHLIQYFNKWAYVQVGLHGRSFLKASRYTWEMLRDQKADLLINDDLTGSVLLTCCIIGGVLTALVGGCWTFATFRYLTVAISIISFFIGFFVTYLTMVVPESAVATLYICFAEDPETLRKHDPACHQYMDDRRSQLEQSIAE